MPGFGAEEKARFSAGQVPVLVEAVVAWSGRMWEGCFWACNAGSGRTLMAFGGRRTIREFRFEGGDR